MRLVLLVGLGCSWVYGQNCAPAPVLPAGTVSGTLRASSCGLSDGSLYDSYRLVISQRGVFQAGFTPAVDGLTVALQDASGAQLASGANIQRAVETGTYTLLVNGSNAAAPVDYTVHTAFAAEPGMWCANFPSLGPTQTVTGTLGASGCKLPDGTLYEAYSLQTFGAGMLTVSVSSSAFMPLLMVRSDSGVLLASDAASVTIPVTASTSYQMVVATLDQTGAYQVTTGFQANPAETCVAQKSFLDSAADAAAIGANSCAVVVDSGGDQAFFNYYSLPVGSAGLVDVAVSSVDFTPQLVLLDAAGNAITSDTSGAGSDPAAGSQSEIRFFVRPGSYVLQVFSNFLSGGNYKLNYTFTPGVPQPCVRSAYTLGSAQSGTISPASCRTGLGLADLYDVTLPNDSTLTIDFTSAAFSSAVAILDTKDNLIAMSQDVEGTGASHLTATLPAGRYTIAAAASTGSGAYQLTTRFAAAAIAPCTQAQDMALNTGFIRALGLGSCVGANGQPVDLYHFHLPSAGTVAAVMTSSQVDGFLTLTDASGAVLRSDLNSYDVNDPIVMQYLPGGDYQLWGRAATSGATGLYQMTLLASLGDRPAFCGPIGSLALDGGGVNGSLGITSCAYADRSFADVYQVNLANDMTVDLQMTSADFDAFLIVLDAKGNVVAQDDDSLGGTDARVVQALPAGTYYVLAKQFAHYYPGGNYTVTLATYQAE